MVLILYGYSDHVAHALYVKIENYEKQIRFLTAFNLIKYLEQIKQERLLPTRAKNVELPSILSKLIYFFFNKITLYIIYNKDSSKIRILSLKKSIQFSL